MSKPGEHGLKNIVGKVRSIGGSNFSQMMLEKILPTAEIIPAVNQVRR